MSVPPLLVRRRRSRLSRGGRRRGRAHARHADDAAPAEAAARASRRCRRASRAPAAPADRRRVQELAAREHRRRCSGSGSSTRAGGRRPSAQSAIVQFYRGVALLWAGYPSDAADGARDGEEARPRHAHPGPGRQPAPPELLPARPRARGYPVFVPLSKNPLLRQGSLLQAQGHQISAERLYQRAAKQSPNDVEALVAAAVGLFDEDNLSPRSRTSARSRSASREPDRPLLPRAALAWTAQGQEAIKQFKKTRRLGPTTDARQAGRRSSSPGIGAQRAARG